MSASQPATAAEIITAFELQVSDMTELSTVEELMVLNRVYQAVCSDRPWEFLRTTFSGVQSLSVPYIGLPDNFGELAPNYDDANSNSYAHRPVVLVGPTNTPYEIIPYAARNRYANASNKAYIDPKNGRLVFTAQPTAANTVSYDYICVPDELSLDDAPLFPKRFNAGLIHGMAVDDFIIQMSDSTEASQQANEAKYQAWLASMGSWNALATGLL